jgi:hypothetical protein
MSVIGNGWTIDIVAHILKGIKGDKMKRRKKNPMSGVFTPAQQQKYNKIVKIVPLDEVKRLKDFAKGYADRMTGTVPQSVIDESKRELISRLNQYDHLDWWDERNPTKYEYAIDLIREYWVLYYVLASDVTPLPDGSSFIAGTKRKKNPTKPDQYMIFSNDGILSRRYWGTVPEDKVEAFIKEISIAQEIPLYEFEAVKLLHPKRKKNPQGKGRNLGYGTNNGGMVKNQLRTIQRVAQQLNDILLMDDEVPDWVLTKVNTAMDRLVVAHHYIQSKLQGMKPNPRVNVQSAIDHANKVVRELE